MKICNKLKEHIPETSSDDNETDYVSLENLFAPSQVVAFYIDDPDICHYFLEVSNGLHVASWKVSDSWGKPFKKAVKSWRLLLQFSHRTELLPVV